MSGNKGFTLTDLIFLLVVACVMVPLMLYGVVCSRSTSHDTSCQENLGNLARALAVYGNNNNDGYPLMNGRGWDTTATGTNRDVDPTDPKAKRSVSSLLFMLVREGQNPKMFACPSDTSVDQSGDWNPKKRTNLSEFAWDFDNVDDSGRPARYLSYSYQLPMSDNTNGVDPNAPDDRLVVIADKTPLASGVRSPSGFNSGVSGDAMKPFMSQNHGGEVVNCATRNSSVIAASRRPDVGVNNDYIYTASDSATSVAQYGGVASQAAHKFPLDSVLMGPN